MGDRKIRDAYIELVEVLLRESSLSKGRTGQMTSMTVSIGI